MAVTSFKQQCPSCEAMVPIRDANLIGRKIDCPKCKYRFVVEEPSNGDGAQEEVGGATVTTKARAKGPARTANGPAAKTAPGVKRRRGEEDDLAEQPGKQPAKANNKKMLFIIGGAIGGVAIAVLVLCAILIFGG